MRPSCHPLRRCRRFQNKTTRSFKTPTCLTNVHGLADSKAGKSTATGQINANTVLQNPTINYYEGGRKRQRDFNDTPKRSKRPRTKAAANVEESRQEDTQQIIQDETSSKKKKVFDPAKEFHPYERRAVPTRKAMEKSKQIFDLDNILILTGCLGEGAFHLIKKLLKAKKLNKIHHLKGFDELKSTCMQEQDGDGRIHVFVIWRPSKTVDEEVERILKSKNRTRKFIIHSECSVLDFRLKKYFSVNLAEINSDENNWTDRVDLMEKITEENKEEIAKQHFIAFPLMCVMYKEERDIFKETWRAISLLIKRIISWSNRSTEAGLIAMVMSNGRFSNWKYWFYAHIIQENVKDVTKNSISAALKSLEGSILKFCEGAWQFSSDIWLEGCTMYIHGKHRSVVLFKDSWLNFTYKIPFWFIDRFYTFVCKLYLLTRKLFRKKTDQT